MRVSRSRHCGFPGRVLQEKQGARVVECVVSSALDRALARAPAAPRASQTAVSTIYWARTATSVDLRIIRIIPGPPSVAAAAPYGAMRDAMQSAPHACGTAACTLMWDWNVKSVDTLPTYSAKKHSSTLSRGTIFFVV